MTPAASEFRSLANFLKGESIYAEPVRTPENQEVWGRVLRHLETLWKTQDRRFFADYLSGLDRLKISASRIPVLAEINQMLSQIGWSAVYVDGMVDDHLYHEMQSAHIFPVARRLRRKRDKDHSAAPDFIHDVIGHLPMLFTAQYRSLVSEWAGRALEASGEVLDADISKALKDLIAEREKDALDSAMIEIKTMRLRDLHRQARNGCPSQAARFARFYAWAIEFGIIASGRDGIQVSGSASLSSPGELRKIFDGETRLVSFIDNALDTPVDYTLPQNSMFIVRDFCEYYDVLQEISGSYAADTRLPSQDRARAEANRNSLDSQKIRKTGFTRSEGRRRKSKS